MTERVFVVPPGSRIGPLNDDERNALIAGSLVAGVYEKKVDRESAYEKLTARIAAAPGASGAATPTTMGTATTPAADDAAGGGISVD